ncbi:hypothetical protein POTOM_042320 [Populus tomentosa]|uniref:Uncharacterized protein n=1 Tax=Populus tomentosa TaxID=118781 RepID=A0A8X8CH98_POPTO|nr:hypothetical protein POTOM_042320 [Populus tomentosa]
MEPKDTKLHSRKRRALTSDKEFRFQPEPEKSKKAHGSLSLGPKGRGDARLALYVRTLKEHPKKLLKDLFQSKSIEPKDTKLHSRKRSALTSDEEFRFQPEPEKSKKAHGSLSLGPKGRGDATLALSSN